MNMTTLVVGLYGLFTFAGGLIGFIKAKSAVSLVTGSVSGILLLICAYGISRGYSWSAITALIVSVLLGGRFLMTLIKHFKLMPDLLMVLLSLASLVAIVLMLLKR